MREKQKSLIIILIYNTLLIVGGLLVFLIPNRKYLGILNADNFFIISCIITLISAVLIFSILKSSTKKLLIHAIVTIVIFTLIGVYYYNNLPQYTYEEAVQKVEKAETASGKNVIAYIPEHHEDKVFYGKGSFFSTTNDKYFIYLNDKNSNKNIAYVFDPLNGEYEVYKGNRELYEIIDE